MKVTYPVCSVHGDLNFMNDVFELDDLNYCKKCIKEVFERMNIKSVKFKTIETEYKYPQENETWIVYVENSGHSIASVMDRKWASCVPGEYLSHKPMGSIKPIRKLTNEEMTKWINLVYGAVTDEAQEYLNKLNNSGKDK